MKTRIFTMLALVTSLALLLAASTSAVSSERPVASPLSGDLGPQSLNAPAVTLGQPGLSFRYVQTFGVTEEPYPADAQHLNGPNGIFIDGSNNLYVVEERGYRLLKYNSSGGNVFVAGHAGLHWGNYLMWPKDVAVVGNGHIWVAMRNCLKEFNATGAEIQLFPNVADPWSEGSDNEHFNDPRGVAFDSAGRMYVADRYNHRVQVYTFTLSSPVYSTTIGVTGVSGNDDAHFNEPHQIVIDGSDRLYVADAGNYRVQRCTFSSGWTCTTFHGTGSAGSGADELDWATGLGIDGSGNVYIADGNNGRVKRCTSGGGCSTFVSGLLGPVDVAVDTTGNVYINDDHAIRKYNGNGVFQTVFAGTTGVPYVTDTARYNAPWGIAVASDGSLYATEEGGFRLVKLNAAGVQQWTVGQAGVWGSDNAHFGSRRGELFGSMWEGLQSNPAVDASGRIYVPDNGNHRVQIFTPDGAYFTTFGSYGDGPYEFHQPMGIAISLVNGDIYVTDRYNHRVQVYNSDRVYKATLGVPDEPGNDNRHFNEPGGVAVDRNGNIYVADTQNHRIQTCTLSGTSYTCATFAGVTGECGNDFDHLCGSYAVAVDASDRVYVPDRFNQRVQVFDSSGAYLTTIGGNWGSNTGQMADPLSVAVDSTGNVYVADHDNHRIQKFAPGVPGWKQVNINGFGDRNNWVAPRMSVWGDYLYASTANDNTGGEVWRTANGADWSQVNLGGFGIVSNTIALVGEAFNGYLYVGTRNLPTGGEIWRCATCNGTDWTRVVTGGLDDGNNNNVQIQRILVFSNTLYATIDNGATGVEVWKSPTGNPGSWIQSNVDGFGDAKNNGLWAAAVFNGYLYAATAQWGSTYTGVEVWRTPDGVVWSQVNANGFGDPENRSPWMEPFKGYLYVLSYNSNTGTEGWRCATCDGNDWVPVVSDGFGDSNNTGGYFMLGLGNYFYAFTNNGTTGTEVWRTTNGVNWSQVSVDGLGNSNNGSVSSGAVFNNSLFIGTNNSANGGEVWQMLHQVYLPVVLRNP